MDTWKYDQRNWYPQEARTFIGNGYIGGSIPLDGHGGRGAVFTASMAGLFAGPHDTAVPVPHWLDIPIKVNGAEVHPIFVNFRQTLDLRHGTMTTAYDDANHAVRVETETFCHRGIRNLIAYRLTVHACKKIDLELEPRLDISLCNPRPMPAPLGDQGLGWLLDYLGGGARVAQTMTLDVAGPMDRQPLRSETMIGLRLRASLEPGQKRVITGIVVTVAGPSPANEAHTILKEAAATGYEALRQSHIAAMADLWKNFQIEAEDPFLERHARSAMFYLLCGYRHDVQWGGTPASLASQAGWGGCVFWDTEFYMYPPLLACYPDLARNTLMYRYNTLDGARRNAAAHGQQGARFAWMSRKTGIAEPGPFEAERHITTDIAYAAWWYRQATGDKEFMDRYGRHLIYEAALQTASLATPNPAGRGWDINGVIGPDEHVMDHYVGVPINNSAMTNAYARWLLETAPSVCPQVTPDQRRHWAAIAAGLPLLRDESKGIYLEYDGYDGHPSKQADIGHMFFPLCVDCDPAEIRRNIYYYADRERETGLFLLHSPFVYAAALSRAGDARGVHRFLVLSDRNHTGPFELPRESNYATSAVVTGSGAFLGLLIYGLLGIENSGDKLQAHPCIADEVGKITLSGLQFRGQRYKIAAAPGSFTLGPA